MNIDHFICGSIPNGTIIWSKALDYRTGNNFLRLCALHNIPYKVMVNDSEMRLPTAFEITERLKIIIDSAAYVPKEELEKSENLVALDFIMDFVWLLIYWQNGFSKGFKLRNTAAWYRIRMNRLHWAASIGIIILSIAGLILCWSMYLKCK